MRVVCRTNLDLHGEIWPTELPALPNVGDLIQSNQKWGVFQLRLKVIRITWKRYNIEHNWYPEIELHDHWAQPRSITEFYEWYAPLVGKTVSSFI